MRRGLGLWGVLMVMALGCKSGADAVAQEPVAPAPEQPVVAAEPTAEPTMGPTIVPTSPDRPIPPGSGDYGAVLAEARKYKRGEIDFAALQAWIVARKLPPHPLGDAYVIMPVPAPPPGVPFDPMMMPGDWVGTWGEVAMAHFAGALSMEEYDRLHAAAHPMCAKGP